MKADAEKIHVLVKENLDYFQAEEDSDHWRSYLDYLDDVVLDGLFECVQCSLQYLKENTDQEKDMPPLMMAKLELQVRSATQLNSRPHMPISDSASPEHELHPNFPKCSCEVSASKMKRL